MTTWLRHDDDGDELGKDGEARELRGLQVNEISLVDRGANRRKFLLLKAEERRGGKDEDTMAVARLTEAETERLETDLNSVADREEELLAAVEKAAGGPLSPAARNACRAALRALNAHQDELGSDLIATLSELVGGEPAGPSKAAQDVAALTKAAGVAALVKSAAGRKQAAVDFATDGEAYERHCELTRRGYEVEGPPVPLAKMAAPKGSALAVIMDAAAQRVAKSAGGLTRSQALLEVTTDPGFADTMEAYQRERREAAG